MSEPLAEQTRNDRFERSRGDGDVNKTQPIAVFDLDGTLTTKDSFVAFLVSFGLKHRRLVALSRMPFLIAFYLCGGMKDFELKQRLIKDFFARVDADTVDRHAAWFSENWLPKHLHPVGHSLLQQHVSKGHRVILLSASPELFVPQIAMALGIDEVVCTRVLRVNGRWTGEIDGKNCKGDEKVAAMRRWLGVEAAPGDCYAYGDSKSDLAVLSWATKGAWIRRNHWEPVGDLPRAEYPGDDYLVSRRSSETGPA